MYQKRSHVVSKIDSKPIVDSPRDEKSHGDCEWITKRCFGGSVDVTSSTLEDEKTKIAIQDIAFDGLTAAMAQDRLLLFLAEVLPVGCAVAKALQNCKGGPQLDTVHVCW